MSIHPRIIARMDIKTNNLIKGVQLEGLKVLGDPVTFAKDYYNQGADELIYLDSVASLYNRSYIEDVIRETAKNVFVPITVGGGIKNLADVEKILRIGADKIAINTSAVRQPILITEISKTFGSQCMVLQLDVKRSDTGYEVYIDGGREKTGINALDWVVQAQDLGCGEILLTSIDRDGTRKGFDSNLVKEISVLSKVPLIVSSGYYQPSHFHTIKDLSIDGFAIGSALHYKQSTITEIKDYWKNNITQKCV